MNSFPEAIKKLYSDNVDISEIFAKTLEGSQNTTFMK
jgi:hypothetical protein